MPSSSKRTATGILICMVVVLAWFSPWWIGGKNLAPLDILHEMMEPWRGTDESVSVKNHFVADAVDQYLVYRQVAAESYHKEGWVGWSSLTYGGTAQHANTMALYYDWTMQLHRWFDFWTAWHLGLIAQVMTAAIGMLLFLRGRSIGLLWSVCGALAYAANSQFVVWIYHRWTLGAFGWVPWILWSIDCYRQGKRGFWTLVPIFIALAMLGGTLQHGAFVVLVVVAAWIEETFDPRQGPGFSTSGDDKLIYSRVRERAPLRKLFILSRYVVWGILGTSLAAMMIFPCADAFFISNRLGLHTGTFGNAGNGIYPQGWLQPLFNSAAYLFQIFPSLLGRCDTLDALKIFKSELFYVAYFGSLPVLIAYLACFRKQTPLLARLLILAGLILPLTPLVRFLYQRLFLLFIFGGVLTFSHFMETASRDTRLRLFKVTAGFTSFIIVVWSVVSIGFYIKAVAIVNLLESKLLDSSSGSAFGYFRVWMEGRFTKFTADLCIWSPQQLFPLILFIMALVGLGLTTNVYTKRKTAGSWLVALAVVMEVTLFGSRWITYTNPSTYPLYPITPEVTALRDNVGRGRVTTLNKDTIGHMAITPFVPNTLSAYGICTIQGYDSIVPDGMALRVNNSESAEQLGRLAVTHLITYPGKTPSGLGWRLIWENSSMRLFKNEKAISKYVGFSSDSDKSAFFSNHDSRRWTSLIEETGNENSRCIEVPAGTEWLRVAENQASGWEYRVINHGGIWRPVIRASDASMIMELSKTDQVMKVEMRYNPPMRRLGMIISCCSLILTLSGGIYVRRS